MPVIVAGVLDQYVMEAWGLIWLSRVWGASSSWSESGSEVGERFCVVVFVEGRWDSVGGGMV